jgi:hypothetical protein
LCLFNSEIQCRHISLQLMAHSLSLLPLYKNSDWLRWDILVFQLCKLQGIGNVSLSFFFILFFFCVVDEESRSWNWSCWLHKSCCAAFRVVFSARLNRCVCFVFVCLFFSLQPIARRRSRYKSLFSLFCCFRLWTQLLANFGLRRYRTGSLSRCKRHFGRKLLAPPLSYFSYFFFFFF